MRGAFTRTLAELAASDRRIVLLTGDLGYTALEPFSDVYPDRFINVGVAEQNMVGLATGLSEAGMIPFVYSIATFASLRPYEFIRNGPILHHLPVRIVAIGGGFEYSTAGSTHHALEDIGVMRLHPGLTVIAPADHEQTANAIRATWDLPGPVYYRLGKDDRTVVPHLNGRFELGRIQIVGDGSDVLFVTMGAIASEAAAAIELLANAGIHATLAIVSTVNPAPAADLIEILARFSVVLTVEAHYINGGVGSLVSEVVAENGLGCRVHRCGVRVGPDGVVGSQRFLEDRHGLSRAALAKNGRDAFENRR